MKIAVTGGRDYEPTEEVEESFVRLLTELVEPTGLEELRVGDCPSGVDWWLLGWLKRAGRSP